MPNLFNTVPPQYDSTTRLIDRMIDEGLDSSGYRMTDLTFVHGDRKFVEVELDNGYKMLFYQSAGTGTGIESKGLWVPTPAIHLATGWIVKRSYLDDGGVKQNPKITKYDVPLFQEIAAELEKNTTDV